MIDVSYNHNMIKKFIFRVDFINEIEQLKNSVPENISSKIIENFPNALMSDIVESEIQVHNAAILKKDSPFKQWEYTSNDNNNKIIITPKFILYDCSNYTSFSDVREKFVGIINEVFAFNNIQIGRIGIRYINVFCASEFSINSINEWDKYFSKEILEFSKFNDGVTENNVINMVNSIEFAYTGFRIKYKVGFMSKNYPLPIIAPDFTIDFDGYSNAIITNNEDLEDSIDSIHNKIHDLFEKSINDQLRSKLNE